MGGETRTDKPTGIWHIVGIGLALVGLAAALLYVGWGADEGFVTTFSRSVAIAFGIVIALALGIGLTALIYLGSRRRRDLDGVRHRLQSRDVTPRELNFSKEENGD
jgi:hypothetical protein